MGAKKIPERLPLLSSSLSEEPTAHYKICVHVRFTAEQPCYGRHGNVRSIFEESNQISLGTIHDTFESRRITEVFCDINNSAGSPAAPLKLLAYCSLFSCQKEHQHLSCFQQILKEQTACIYYAGREQLIYISRQGITKLSSKNRHD
jgi:hypothetical protein